MGFSTSRNRAYATELTARQYIHNLLETYMAEPDPCLFLPSFMGMSKMLGCSAFEVYHLLNELKDKGFDFFTLDMDTPITLWHPAKVQMMT